MYEVIQVEWEPNYQDEIKEIYRMFKDQERRIFDLTNYEDGISVMDLIEKMDREDTVFLVKENDTPCATFVLTSPRRFNNVITRKAKPPIIYRHGVITIEPNTMAFISRKRG